MKKIALLFIIFALITGYAQDVSAQEESSKAAETFMDVTSVDNSKTDDYVLPYPGLLPDNPLYQLKTFRDKVIGLLISDPEKQSQFNLLQADKRLQSGMTLIDKNKKYELAITTISKGENYLEEAIFKVKEVKKQGRSVSSLQDTLIKASKKHVSVLRGLQKNAPKEYKQKFQTVIKHSERLVTEAIKI